MTDPDTEPAAEPGRTSPTGRTRRPSLGADWQMLMLGIVFVIGVAAAFSYIMSENPKPSDYGSIPSAFVGTFADGFDRAPASRGLNGPSNNDWVSARGEWAIQVGVAYIAKPDPQLNLAVVDVGSSQNAISGLVGGLGVCGVVAKFSDDQNYIALERVPGYGVWNVVEVVAGTPTLLGKVDDSADQNVRVTLATGANVIVATVGAREATFVRTSVLTGTKAGLIGEQASDTCAWDDVTVQAAR